MYKFVPIYINIYDHFSFILKIYLLRIFRNVYLFYVIFSTFTSVYFINKAGKQLQVILFFKIFAFATCALDNPSP